MSINQMLLEQKIRQQERAAKAEERAQANIIKKMQLPSDVLRETDPRVLKSYIVRQIEQMDEMLAEYESIQNIINNQSDQMNKMERQESAGRDATIQQLQKELEDQNKKYREALMLSKQQLSEISCYRADRLTSKVSAGNHAIQEMAKQQNLLVAQKEMIQQLDIRTLFDYFQQRFYGSPLELENQINEQEQQVLLTGQMLADMTKSNDKRNDQQRVKINEIQKEKERLEQKTKEVSADLEFIQRLHDVLESDKKRQNRAQQAEQAQ